MSNENENFTEEEMQEAEYLSQAEEEQAKPKKKMVKTYFNPVAFKEDIAINLADLDNAFISQAAQFAHYSMQAAKAAEQVDNLKLLLDVEEAKLNSKHRDLLQASGIKITEQVVTNAVLTDPRYIKVRKAYNEAKTVLEMLKGSTEAFRQRRDMLIQIGTNDRQEKKGEMYIRSIEEKNDREERLNRRVAR